MASICGYRLENYKYGGNFEGFLMKGDSIIGKVIYKDVEKKIRFNKDAKDKFPLVLNDMVEIVEKYWG